MRVLHTVLFRKVGISPSGGWTRDRASKWLKKHNLRVTFPGKNGPDETTNFLRYRQRHPLEFDSASFRTYIIPNTGIELVYGNLR